MCSIPFSFWFRRCCFGALFCLLTTVVFSQTLGGKSAYAFLKLPATPLQTAAGGVIISYKAEEVGLTSTNPALLSREVSHQINASFHSLLAGTKGYSLTGALYSNQFKTTFGGHISYLDYGTLNATDAAGTVIGEFRPVDFVVQLAASKQYLEKWTYGLAVKFVQSTYGQYQSNAVAADVGVLYFDSTNAFSASVLVK
ncbi:MAG TPA: hypothetical protein VFL47_15970, partial [Flavisolibacter sp.]|nr:hypothetical protein [Flavisolibacter sp.]